MFTLSSPAFDDGLSDFSALSTSCDSPAALDYGVLLSAQQPQEFTLPVKVKVEESPDVPVYVGEEVPNIHLGDLYSGFPPMNPNVIPQPVLARQIGGNVGYGVGSDDVVTHDVVNIQAESNILGRYKDEEVKQEFSNPEQNVVSPVGSDEGKESLPFPPDLEPPAIFGGKLPPRATKTRAKKHVYTERELRIRRKKGLPDDSDSESEERRFVRLPRRSLLKITTSQMSDFVKFTRQRYQLSPSQKDELSKQKRLVKNRESACRFRAKKVLSLLECNERLAELETDVVTLREENERLRRQLLEMATTSGLPIPE